MSIKVRWFLRVHFLTYIGRLLHILQNKTALA